MLKEGRDNKLNTAIFIISIIVVLILIFSIKPIFTAKAIALEKDAFMPNEKIKGTFTLILNEGELIPSNTEIIVQVDENQINELTLEEFIKLNNLAIEEQQGNFFMKDKEILGEGFGYGEAGHYIVHPDIDFQLRIISPPKEEEQGSEEPFEEPFETFGEEGNISEENITKEPEENIAEIIEEPIEELPLEEPIEEQPTEEPIEELPLEEPIEEQPQEPEETEPSINTLSILAIFNRFFSFWSAFAILEENGQSKIIEASCSIDDPFYYEIEEGDEVELVEGSVKTDGEILKDSKVDFYIEDNILAVTTNYFESYEGFGEAYLGDDYKIELNLDVLDLDVEEKGVHTLTISLIYDGQELMSESEDIEIKPGLVTIKIIDKHGNIEDEISASNTKIKIKIKKTIIDGGEEEHDIEVEDNLISITAGAIIESQEALPDSEINFITFSNDTVIQIDKPSNAQETQGISTEIFAIEPDNEIEVQSAVITLEKFSQVSNIIYCDDWSTEDFDCKSTWQDSGLDFYDNGTHISFETTHFTGYAGNYTGESNTTNLKIWDDGYPDNPSMKFTGDAIHFYANYSDALTSKPIDNSIGSCQIIIGEPVCGDLPAWSNKPMTYNASTGLYKYTKTFTNPGIVNYSVDCENTGSYDNLSTYDDNALIVDLKCSSNGGGGTNVNCDITLHTNQSTTGTCFNVNANNVVIDCQNNNINGLDKGIYGIQSWNDGLVVKNCEISDFSTGIEANGDNINISFNILEDNNDNGFSTGFLENSIISNNIIRNSLHTGIFCGECYNVTIFDNDVDSNTNKGIEIVMIFSGNNASFNNISNSKYGFYISDEKNIISNNRIEDCDYGFYLNNFGAIHNEFYDNTIIDCIIDYCSQNTADWNYVSNLEIDSYTLSFNSSDINLSQIPPELAPPEGWKTVEPFYGISNTSVFDSWLYLNLSYNESALGSLKESTLRLWKWNGSAPTGWFQVDSDIDTANDVVYSDLITNFSLFVIEGQEAPPGGGGGGGGSYCGDNDCDSDENCTTCPEDCHYCGDGCCILNETYQNCWLDCCYPEGAEKPVLPNRTCCSGLQSGTVYDMDCVQQQGQCSGCEMIGTSVCINCGNNICGPGENYCNCPEDCEQEIASCEQLPQLSADIDFNWGNSLTRLSWQQNPGANIELLRAEIYTADECVPSELQEGYDCDFSLKAKTKENEWSKNILDRLKFLKVIGKTKVGQGNCKPECYTSEEAIEGWYDPCIEELLKNDNCNAGVEEKQAYCCYPESDSEGWYDTQCSRLEPDITQNLIRYADCEEGEYALLCNQESDIFAKFTQELIYNQQRGEDTSINWFVYLPLNGITNTYQLLYGGYPFDYIAYWGTEQQTQSGSARGELQNRNYILEITGNFDLESYHPYFISPNIQVGDRFTWVGKIPEHIVFKFTEGRNYIALPLDSTLNKASHICENLDLLGYETVGYWVPENQEIIAFTCDEIEYYGLDFDLLPGSVYYLALTSDKVWPQQ